MERASGIFTLFLQLTFSGSFTAGGDPLNLATLSNPNGLDVEGLFELPLSLAPAVYLEDIGGYYVQPKVSGSTLNAFLINVYAPGGAIVSGAYATAVTNGMWCSRAEAAGVDGGPQRLKPL